MRLPNAVYHAVCRRWHDLFYASEFVVVSIGVYIGWVRCAGSVLHVYASSVRVVR